MNSLEKAGYSLHIESMSLNGAWLEHTWQATATQTLMHTDVQDITPDPAAMLVKVNDASYLTTVVVGLNLPLRVKSKHSWLDDKIEETKFNYVIFGVDVVSTLETMEHLIKEVVAKHDPNKPLRTKGY